MGDGWIIQETMEDACEGLQILDREHRHPSEGGARGVRRGTPAQVDADAYELVNMVEAVPGSTSKEEARGIVPPRVRGMADAQVWRERP